MPEIKECNYRIWSNGSFETCGTFALIHMDFPGRTMHLCKVHAESILKAKIEKLAGMKKEALAIKSEIKYLTDNLLFINMSDESAKP